MPEPNRQRGAIAQLVERFHGMEEVRSSILLSSTENPRSRALEAVALLGRPVELTPYGNRFESQAGLVVLPEAVTGGSGTYVVA